MKCENHYSGLILASGSQQRKDMFDMIGVPYEIVVSDVDEKKYYDHSPEIRAEKLSILKAQTVQDQFPEAVIVAGDAYGVFGGKIFEKASNKEVAFSMLMELSAKEFQLIAGYAVWDPHERKMHSGFDQSTVVFKKLSDEVVMKYLRYDEWIGKAPPFTIRGRGMFLVEKMNGSLYTILGLPLEKVLPIINSCGIEII